MKIKLTTFFTVLIITSGISPVFAEVTDFQLDQNSYQRGDLIGVTGKVTEDSSGLVTIVLRDPNNEFVLLNQAIIRADNTFEKTILINEKFEIYGSHNATAFVTNVTAAKIQPFELIPESSMAEMEVKEESHQEPNTETISDLNEILSESEISALEEINKEFDFYTETTLNQENTIADFVDPAKDPQYYLDRYYTEPKYKSWFDRNYPERTIEDAVGYISPPIQENQSDDFVNEIIPPAEATSIQLPQNNNKDNSEFAQIGLALGGMAILFGAVYGIKRKVDDNSKRISINKSIIRKKIFSPIVQPKPKDIIQRRLAIGEITLDEYEQLCRKLDNETR